ncbi:uncharacterized protein PpBr36_05694 [Pyricularia pennisetigena]|uniref:uncharacterized protein n=1 Tax=Pyricularia pennisetigena TaxID=1578925 RepID=UPI0011529C15|nr:uncharacterized protein PpBr36_05694 [Pyricularia pennisetigena]TLS23127.1 hypothetical protein PpBr36_05694 [Pyricularia pennisetigena]
MDYQPAPNRVQFAGIEYHWVPSAAPSPGHSVPGQAGLPPVAWCCLAFCRSPGDEVYRTSNSLQH